MRNVYLYAPNFVTGSGSVTTVWLPYSVGAIWSYAKDNPEIRENYQLKGLGLLRESIDQVVGDLDNPRVCGFSTYVWNEQYNLALSQAIKQRWPECHITFGGPNVPNQESEYRSWRQQHPWIDSTIRYEGEQSFAQLLLDLLNAQPKKDYVSHRLEDLAVPSPYLSGTFDSIVKDTRYQYAMTLETNRGCPFACTFCDWGSLTYSKVKRFPLERVLAEIEWAGRNRIEFLVVADANFGMFPDRDREIIQKLIEVKQQYGYPTQFNTNWYKNSNAVILDIADLLSQHKLNRGLTLSVQSMNPDTLKAIKRQNMKINDLGSLFQDCNRRQIPFYTELILGLPLETLDSWRQGHYELLEMGQHGCVFVFPVEVLRNSELGLESKQYQIESAVIEDYWQCTVTGLNEQQHIVMSTSTMSQQDLIDATMFSWMIVTFHHHGWCEIYARYLRSQGWSYQEIYNNLEVWLSQDEYFAEQIDSIKSGVSDFYLNHRGSDYYATWATVKTLFQNRDQSSKKLAQWFRQIYSGDLAQQVIDLQQVYITDPEINDTISIAQPNNLLGTILEYEQEFQIGTHHYELTPTSRWDNIDEFLAFVVLRRKEGFGKNRVRLKS